MPEPTLLSDLELVTRQLHCVKHLCHVTSELAEAMARILPTMATMTDGAGHHMIKMQGQWSASFMDWVGEMLNGMDAVDEADEKWGPTFIEASRRWKNLTAELNAPK